MHLIKLYPAYGRTPNLQEARAEFFDGKDFSITRVGGPYISIRDFLAGDAVAQALGTYDAVILLVPDKILVNNMKRCVVTVDEMREIKEGR